MKEKSSTIILTIIGIILISVITTLIVSCYLKSTGRDPFFMINYKEGIDTYGEGYSIPNGSIKEGLLFVKYSCLDGNIVYKTRFAEAHTCSVNRIFNDGMYINQNNVSISKNEFDQIYEFHKIINGEMADITFNIDDYTQSTFDRALEHAKAKGLYDYEYVHEQSNDEYNLELLYKSKEMNIDYNRKDLEKYFDTSKKYCLAGMDGTTMITYPYENEECQIPQDICNDVINKEGFSYASSIKNICAKQKEK